jgi:hypothetical protein
MAGRNPRYNGRVGLYPTYRIEKMSQLCNNMVAFPSVGTPSHWYKAGLTASTNTNGFNTVSGTEWTWWYDYSGNGKSLAPPYSYAKFDYSLSYIKNELYYFGTPDGDASYMSAPNTDFTATSGKGTAVMVWRTATNNTNSIYAFAKPSGSITRGYIMTPSYVTIFGDTQTYTFNNTQLSGSQWNITIVSVDSAGNPNTYKNNGVQGATSSYTNPLGTGIQPIISFDSYNGVSIAEFMWFGSPLSSTQCDSVESYLKQRWCIDY